jgi:hypothetical protein
LHGGFGTLEDFEPIISNFLTEFRIIAMDAEDKENQPWEISL